MDIFGIRTNALLWLCPLANLDTLFLRLIQVIVHSLLTLSHTKIAEGVCAGFNCSSLGTLSFCCKVHAYPVVSFGSVAPWVKGANSYRTSDILAATVAYFVHFCLKEDWSTSDVILTLIHQFAFVVQKMWIFSHTLFLDL